MYNISGRVALGHEIVCPMLHKFNEYLKILNYCHVLIFKPALTGRIYSSWGQLYKRLVIWKDFSSLPGAAEIVVM